MAEIGWNKTMLGWVRSRREVILRKIQRHRCKIYAFHRKWSRHFKWWMSIYIYINWLDGNQQKIVVDSQKHGRDHHTREDLIRKNKVVFILPATNGCKPGISWCYHQPVSQLSSCPSTCSLEQSSQAILVVLIQGNLVGGFNHLEKY